MTTVQLPLFTNSSFEQMYFGYINGFQLDKTTYKPEASSWRYLSDLKAQLVNDNTIQFYPFVDSNPSNFILSGSQYIPQNWLQSSVYQERNYDLFHIFKFQGNFQTNTLHTSYADNYSAYAFIKAFDSWYNVIAISKSQENTLGNFDLTLDTTGMSNIAHLQYGFEIDGYPVYIAEANNIGSVVVSNFVTTNTNSNTNTNINTNTNTNTSTNVYLPLNNNNSQFGSYNGYTNVFELDKTTYNPDSSSWRYLSDLRGQIVNDNTIQYFPFALYDSPSYWFNLTNGKYIPQKWIESSLYQQRSYDLNNIFKFQGNFQSNSLKTSYGDNYSVYAFIKAFDQFYNILAISKSPANTLGNFDISLDTTSISNIVRLQWGFEIDGYVVHGSEANSIGSVVISDTVPITETSPISDNITTVCQIS
jgi:hypothetical protein